MDLEIHVYKTDGKHKTLKAKDLDIAKAIADEAFKMPNVYKVKVWNGPAVPNIVNHPNLVYHLV